VIEELRVWLEPGYDHGRIGAWMLDWPGAFTWGPTRETALARAVSATYRFQEWLDRHGDHDYPDVGANVTIVDEVPTRRLDDGYQVMATFAADDRPVDVQEMNRHIQRLVYARDDLLEVVGQLRQLERDGTPAAGETRDAAGVASGAVDSREVEQVFAHLGQTDAWFVSRLDANAKYQGPREEDVDAFLEQSFEFLVDRLRRIQAADPAAKRTDGRGETWTLAKLMRRTLYHALDHLEELQRRLDHAAGAMDAIEVRKNAAIDVFELERLLTRAGIGRRFRGRDDRTARMLAGTTETASAWHGDELVGFARIITDDVTNGYIATVAVAPSWQDRGLGTRLMHALMDGREDLKLILEVRPGVEAFYERLGFERATSLFVRRRPPEGAA
jgi:ribosomal protein S18 acetylase RimI-like enzyme